MIIKHSESVDGVITGSSTIYVDINSNVSSNIVVKYWQYRPDSSVSIISRNISTSQDTDITGYGTVISYSRSSNKLSIKIDESDSTVDHIESIELEYDIELLHPNDLIIKEVANRYYPVGHYMITSSNVNPNTLGVKGTWVLKQKKLDPKIIENLTFFTFPSTASDAHQINHCDGYTIWTKMWFKTSQTFSDTAINLATCNIDSISTTQVTLNMYANGWLHGSAASAVQLYMSNITASTRTVNLQAVEIWNRSGTRSIAGSSYNLHFEIPILCYGDSIEFKDEVCNEFYWLRTA